LVVAFSHPLCTDCRTLTDELRASGRPYVAIDVRDRRDLARKYGIAVVPTAVAVGSDGRVQEWLAG
jgi:thioredoxin-like negative regulator of GroEL